MTWVDGCDTYHALWSLMASCPCDLEHRCPCASCESLASLAEAVLLYTQRYAQQQNRAARGAID